MRWMGTLHLGILSSPGLDGKLLTFQSFTLFFSFMTIRNFGLDSIPLLFFIQVYKIVVLWEKKDAVLSVTLLL